jgi:hypothetical protein
MITTLLLASRLLSVPAFSEDCEDVLQECQAGFLERLEAYSKLDCNSFEEQCAKAPETAKDLFLLDCNKLKTLKEKFKSFPEPARYLETCLAEEEKCKNQSVDAAATKLKKSLDKPCRTFYFSVDEPRSKIEIEMKMPFGMPSAKIPAIPAAPKMPQSIVAFTIYREEILAFHPECLTKEKAAPLPFCSRLYREPHSHEGDRGPLPADLAGATQRAYTAGLPHKKMPIRLEFHNVPECKAELIKQDRAFGSVIAFFEHYSLDQDKICAALLSKEIGPLWHFVQGSIATNHQTPVIMTGRFDSN